MTGPRWIAPFLGGVAVAALARALLRDAAGHAVLVDLAQGQRLWRSAEPMQPLALDGEFAFGLAFGPARVAALDAASGVERWRSEPLPWPGWASSSAQAAGLDGASDLQAGWAAREEGHERADLLLAWRLRRPASGMQRAVPSGEGRGACHIARADGSIMQLDDAGALADHAAASVVVAEAIESSDPAVLAQQQFRGVRYALAQRPAGAEAGEAGEALSIVLEAVPTATPELPVPTDPASTPARRAGWQCVLDDSPAPRRMPGPPPPHR